MYCIRLLWQHYHLFFRQNSIFWRACTPRQQVRQTLPHICVGFLRSQAHSLPSLTLARRCYLILSRGNVRAEVVKCVGLNEPYSLPLGGCQSFFWVGSTWGTQNWVIAEPITVTAVANCWMSDSGGELDTRTCGGLPRKKDLALRGSTVLVLEKVLRTSVVYVSRERSLYSASRSTSISLHSREFNNNQPSPGTISYSYSIM